MAKQIIPSILSANRKELQSYVKMIEPYVKAIHIDVMDGRFVPEESFCPETVELLKTKLHKEVHLMTINPEKDIEDYAAAGAGTIIIHAEVFDSDEKLTETLKKIKKLKIKAGISINPETPVSKIKPVLKDADLVLVMTVHPGKGGQQMIPECLEKVREIRKLNKKIAIEVDGGINKDTIKDAAKAGADRLVVGSAIFCQKYPVKAMKSLKKLII